MGLLITSLVILIGLAGTITGLVIKPIINLNKTITKLDCTINELVTENSSTKKHFAKNDEEIDNLQKTTLEQSGELKLHDTRIKALERKKGGR